MTLTFREIPYGHEIPPLKIKIMLESKPLTSIMLVRRLASALEDIPNIQVMMVMKSMASRSMVMEKYNWQWYYYFLTNEGIDYY